MEMTKEEINRAIAEKVMGWTWLRDITLEINCNPAERIDHAWMVLEKFDVYEIEHYEDWMRCRLGINGKFYFGPRSDTAPMAICLAALEAAMDPEMASASNKEVKQMLDELPSEPRPTRDEWRRWAMKAARVLQRNTRYEWEISGVLMEMPGIPKE